MGSHDQFTCTACDYSAEVSGGDDVGMMVLTTTIACETCKKLYDVEVGPLHRCSPEPATLPKRCPASR